MFCALLSALAGKTSKNVKLSLQKIYSYFLLMICGFFVCEGVKIIMKSLVFSAGPVRSVSATSVHFGEEW